MVAAGTRMLQVQGLSFKYGEVPIFRDIDLSIDTGEVFCLLGPNGCGKTTLLDCVLGLHRPESGNITLQDRNIAAMTPREAAALMSYVPPTHEMSFSFSVIDVVLMGRTAFTGLFSSPGHEDLLKAESLLKEMKLQHLRDRDYTTLSGGESQMVMIMRALAQESSLIVMDEPACHLDFRNELFLLETIVSIVKRGSRSVLMSTHSPNQALFLESRGLPVRVGMMHEGILRKVGTPSEVLRPDTIEEIYGVKSELVRCTESEGEGLCFSSLVPMRTVGGM